MSSTFKFHSQVGETTPWQANYSFPNQSTNVTKQTVKLQAKTGFDYQPGQTCRIEFPADNYLNVLNSVLLLDLDVGGSSQLQRGGAHNLIKRLKINYGSLVLEDIQEYKTIVRILYETGVQQDYSSSTGTILDGMYEPVLVHKGATSTVNTYTKSEATTTLADLALFPGTIASNAVGTKRTFALNLMSGTLTAEKLIPLKWMASQMSIEITWASYKDAFVANTDANPTCTISNVQYLAEMVSFSDTYDAAFTAGLRTGVPIKFSSWHYHSFNVTGSTAQLQIHERSRSVKAAFAVMRSATTESSAVDSDMFFHNAGAVVTTATGTVVDSTNAVIDQFQWRVGGTYYPSQPVSCLYGAAEAMVELQKTLNSLGNYSVASSINITNWASYPLGIFSGQKFIMACEFENVDVMPGTIAGINAEEQSDISLMVKFSGPSISSKKIDVFIHYDALMIIREDNYVDLVM